jgi:5'-nucleotidase
LGNLFADLMREATSGAAVAITNGGGLRADLPQGPLTYGALFEAMPFDNRLVRVSLTGRELKRVFVSHFSQGGSIVSVSGVRVRVLCDSGGLSVSLTRERGRPILDDDPLTVVTSDFLATGGDRLFEPVAPLRVISRPEGDPLMRDAMAERLRSRGGSLRQDQLLDPKAPRLAYEGRRPIRCAPRRAESIAPSRAPEAGRLWARPSSDYATPADMRSRREGRA